MGKICDLSYFDPSLATSLIQSNDSASELGHGYIYGQLVGLGYTEYQMIDKKWISYGFANQSFVLKRR
jgi:hypothetical protein